MSLFLVTGLPGTGKSTVCAELKSRGYEAYDGDSDHLAKWYNNQTGKPAGENHERTPEFVQTHSRYIAYQVVKDLSKNALSKPVFLCGDPENEDQLVGLFTEVFALVIGEKVRRLRLAMRTNSQWGKLPHETARDLAIKPLAEKRYKNFSYIIIDTTQPINEVVNSILDRLPEEHFV